MRDRGKMAQVRSGVWLAAKVLLSFATAGMLFGGIGIVRSQGGDVRPGSLLDHHSLILVGGFLLVIATTILIVAIKRWVTILPGVLGYGTLGGLIMLFTGHYGKNSVPRLEALGITLLLISSSSLALTFQDRTLNVLDKMALLAFAFCMAGSAAPKSSTMFIAIGTGMGCLLLAWAYDRFRKHNGRNIDTGIRRKSARSKLPYVV